MVERICVDNTIYDSCQDYVDRTIRQKLANMPRPACDGYDSIRELCEKCPYYRLSKVDAAKN